MQVLLPPGWPRPKGYSNGVAARGRMVFVAGMIGWDAQGVFHTDTLCGQVRQALQNIVEVLAEGGARPEHIVRMTWYVTDKKDYGDDGGGGIDTHRGPRQGRDRGHGRGAGLTRGCLRWR
jgi:enamine deaminase RidA (YjgF/YER057c/UK114 family)